MSEVRFVASSYEVGHCGDPECDCIHFYLHCPEGIASGAIHVALIPKLIETLQAEAYAIAAMKGHEDERSERAIRPRPTPPNRPGRRKNRH